MSPHGFKHRSSDRLPTLDQPATRGRRQYDTDEIDFDEFEQRKSELLAPLDV